MSLLTWPWRLITGLAWYAKEFVVANLSVTWDIITPTHLSSPSIVRYDTHCHTEWEVSMLSMLIALTPGTIVLATQETTRDAEEAQRSRGVRLYDPDARRFRIYVHSMFEDEPRHVRRDTAALERHMLAAMRPIAGAPPKEAHP